MVVFENIFINCESKILFMKFNKLDHTIKGKIRPRFKLESTDQKENIMQIIKLAAEKDDSIDIIQQQSRFLRISIPIKEQHYWSPLLKISCNDNEVEGKTIIRGHIGPNESVWGIFFLSYSAIALVGFFGGIWAYAQWLFNKNPYLLVIIPVCALLLSTMFITSKIGQNKAKKQTLHIMRFLRKAVDNIECTRIA